MIGFQTSGLDQEGAAERASKDKEISIHSPRKNNKKTPIRNIPFQE
jgi:hypothetical protein